MPACNFHLWDHGQVRIVSCDIGAAATAGVVPLLDCVPYDGRNFHPVSCLPAPGPSCMYVSPADEDTVIAATLFHWRARRQQHDATDGGIARYHTAYSTRLAALDALLASLDSLDAWLTAEIFEGFVSLHNGVIGYHAGFSPRRALLTRMIADINALPERPKNLVAVGSGFGRILLPLKQAFPDIHCCGIEPSPAGLEITRRAAAHFGLEVELHQCTIAEAASTLAKRFDLALTHSVVVQIPEAPLTILRQLGALTTRWVHLYEHFTEMLGATRRDIMSLYYLTNIARYETGMLMPIVHANGQGFHLRQATRLGNALNPFEEPSFVQIEVV